MGGKYWGLFAESQNFGAREAAVAIERLWTIFFSMQRLSKLVSAATGTHATIEVLMETMFSIRLVQRGYKEGNESRTARTQEWLRWRGPAAIVNGRPVLSSGRAPHINKSATAWQ
jgi:hypothetical protein